MNSAVAAAVLDRVVLFLRLSEFLSSLLSRRLLPSPPSTFLPRAPSSSDLGQVSCPYPSPEMAPITDSKVDELRTQYHALEERIHRLEQRLETGEAKPTVADSMRLILIGPPGAGSSAGPRLEMGRVY